MKIKMLTTENCLQLVLDSENDYEKEVLEVFEKLPNTKRATFSKTVWGYYREFEERESLLIIFPNEQPKPNLWKSQ